MNSEVSLLTSLTRNLPELVHDLILPHLEKNDLLAYRETCSDAVKVSKDAFAEAQANVYPYGTFSPDEENAQAFALRVSQTLTLKDKLGVNLNDVKKNKEYLQKNPKFVIYDENGLPVVKHYQSFFNPKLSFFGRWKEKYSFYRGVHNQDFHKKAFEIFAHHEEVSKQLTEDPLNASYPLQSMRNRCTRMKSMHQERNHLNAALDSNEYSYNLFYKNLTLFEKVSIVVLSFFHSCSISVRSCIQSGLQSSFDVKSRPTFEDLADWTTLNKRVPFGSTEIQFKGETIKVDIVAEFIGFTHTRFSLIDHKNPGRKLGYLDISKDWNDGSGLGPYSEDVFGEPKNPLTERKLHIKRTSDHLGQDPATNDIPITRLLTQLAVEIFERSDETTLTIDSVYNDFDVFANGGFNCSYRQNLYELIQKRTKEAREAGRLFPDYEDHSAFTVTLHKDREYHGGTKFYREVKTGPGGLRRVNIPVKVSFDFKEPKTWEELIRESRLLTAGTGTVLPRVMTRDLSKLEAKA